MLYDNLKALKQKLIDQGIEKGRNAEATKMDDGIGNLPNAGVVSASDIARFISLTGSKIFSPARSCQASFVAIWQTADQEQKCKEP